MTGSSPRLFILCGPTAVGKGTVVGSLLQRYQDQFYLSISATTRPPRPGEIEGKSYFFIPVDEFLDLVATDQMLEWASVHGQHYYGTPREPVEQALAQGKPVLLEIDLAGARQVQEKCPDAYGIFLKPPSWEELVRRLEGRDTESPEEQLRRLNTARTEMKAQNEFDSVIVNDTVENTVSQVAKIMGLE